MTDKQRFIHNFKNGISWERKNYMADGGYRYQVVRTNYGEGSFCVEAFFHENLIAQKHTDGTVEITTAGWGDSKTTRGLLEELVNCRLHTQNHGLYLNGHFWNGDWVDPSEFKGEEPSTDFLNSREGVIYMCKERPDLFDAATFNWYRYEDVLLKVRPALVGPRAGTNRNIIYYKKWKLNQMK